MPRLRERFVVRRPVKPRVRGRWMPTAEAIFREGVALHRRGDFEGAITRYQAVLQEMPDLLIARDNLCLALLANGDYAAGFALYDVRFERVKNKVERPSLSFPEWRGEPIKDRSLLIWPEQGFGDQLMFARFAASLVEAGARVSMVVPPPLARLFGSLPVSIIVAAGSVSIPQHDFWIMAGSIPGRLRTTLATLPREPYLPCRPGGHGVGLVTRGDPRHHNDENRSLPSEFALSLQSATNAISLAPEDTRALDFEDTAEIIRGLDLVIAVDTSVAHLAGAMGKPLWILLPAANTDWRWMSGRSDSPWYPSARLYRQRHPGDWAPIVADIAEAAQTRTVGSPSI